MRMEMMLLYLYVIKIISYAFQINSNILFNISDTSYYDLFYVT